MRQQISWATVTTVFRSPSRPRKSLVRWCETEKTRQGFDPSIDTSTWQNEIDENLLHTDWSFFNRAASREVGFLSTERSQGNGVVRNSYLGGSRWSLYRLISILANKFDLNLDLRKRHVVCLVTNTLRPYGRRRAFSLSFLSLERNSSATRQDGIVLRVVCTRNKYLQRAMITLIRITIDRRTLSRVKRNILVRNDTLTIEAFRSFVSFLFSHLRFFSSEPKVSMKTHRGRKRKRKKQK